MKIHFTYERMEPLAGYPVPRTIRSDLATLLINKYKGKNLSDITLSTEFVLKKLRGKTVLKYKVINMDWDGQGQKDFETRKMKDVKFTGDMFRWLKGEEPDHGVIEDSFYD